MCSLEEKIRKKLGERKKKRQSLNGRMRGRKGRDAQVQGRGRISNQRKKRIMRW